MLKPALFANWQKLSTRIVGLLLSFLAVALLVIGSTLLLSWQLEGSAAAINVAGSLRMDSYRLAMLAGQLDTPAGRTDPAAASLVGAQMKRIDATLALLERGDPQRPLFLPPTTVIQGVFAEVRQQWRTELAPRTGALLARYPTPVSYTHLTLPTKRIV